MKQKPVLLSEEKPPRYEIALKLQGNNTAVFTYSDREMAENHYEELRARGVIGHTVIKHIRFGEIVSN